MSERTQSDLQRRLTSVRVPRPPAGLAARIKSEIPDPLRAGAEMERTAFQRSMAANLRVAASVLFLVSVSYLFVHLLSQSRALPPTSSITSMRSVRDGQPDNPRLDRGTIGPAPLVAVLDVPVSQPGIDPSGSRPALPSPAVARQRTMDRPGSVIGRTSEAAPVSAVSVAAKQEAPPAERSGTQPAVVSYPDAAQGIAAAAPWAKARQEPSRSREMMETKNEARELESPTAVSSAPPARDAVSRPSAMDSAAEARKPAVDRTGTSASEPQSTFGISLDPHAFDRVKEAIERGERPETVNVDALVNYFAGASGNLRGLRFEAEGSMAPVNEVSFCCVLRLTLDTPANPLNKGLPAGRNAHVEVEFDPASVVSHRRMGGKEELTGETSLANGLSVTGVYAVQLKTSLQARQVVATVRLRYQPAGQARERTITHVLHAKDFVHPWRTASRRHRLSSLGAVWGETLNGIAGGGEVASRAEELATQNPRDGRLRELAQTVSASSRLRSSSPTGSGR